VLATNALRAQTDPAAFFESKVRPLLVDQCFKCHGEKKRSGGLRVDSLAALQAGGDQGSALVVGKPEESLIVKAVRYGDENLQMPPNKKLSDAQIRILETWIRQGAVWPGAAAAAPARQTGFQISDKDRSHWAFLPRKPQAVPDVRDAAWARNPVDRFVLAKLESKGLTPSPEADRRTLVRRLTFDLTGLPPTPAEVQAFTEDESPDAYERLVERLLASPAYGERWGRHWLDLVRYAETNSYERDNPKPHAYRYRDYVVESLNADKPMDRFVKEQLAGDELYPGDAQALVATGFYRLGIWDDEPADKEQARYDGLDDVVATTGQVFLGLTIDCARCHDHKIDPVSQADYYKLLAFFHNVNHFNNGGPTDERPIFRDAAEQGKYHAALAQLDRDREENRRAMDRLASEFRAEVARRKLPPVTDRALPEDVRVNGANFLGKEWARRFQRTQAESKRLERAMPKCELALVATEAGPQPPVTHLMVRGNPHVPGKAVAPGFPEVLTPDMPALPTPPPGAKSSGRRTVLAEWIASADNRLTARVLANRLWQYHFGRGLVRSANNFGLGGDKPTHPELLDWLADRLVAQDWRLKSMHRMLVTSATYRMASFDDPAKRKADPANDLFWRFDMRRLTAEEIRDSLLAVGGRLYRRMFGPSIYPAIPKEVLAGQSVPGKGWHTTGGPEADRRSAYIHVKRSLLVPIVEAFDAPELDRSTPARFASTQPAQALVLFNSDFAHREARRFAERLRAEAGSNLEDFVAHGFWLAFGRAPKSEELAVMRKLHGELLASGVAPAQAHADLALVLLNANEFVFVD
jgi:cytochrome c553